MLLYAQKAEPKRRIVRSRAGCLQCKSKKLKCDEKRPQCGRCVDRQRSCEYRAPGYGSHNRVLSKQSSLVDGDISNAVGRYLSPAKRTQHGSPSAVPTLSTDSPPDDGSSPTSNADWDHEIRRSVTPSTPHPVVQTEVFPESSVAIPQKIDSPLFGEITRPSNRRSLLHYFSSELSTLMSFTSDTGNPFQELVLPLCSRSQPLLHAVLALNCAHLELKGIQNKEPSISLHTQALHSLGDALSRKEQGPELVAAVVMLIYYETLVQRGESNNVRGHLEAALSMVKRLPRDNAMNKFLYLALSFHDVIAALSFGTAVQSSIVHAGMPVLDVSETPTEPSIDALLGMTTELWPVISRISQVKKMQNEVSTVNALGYSDAASALQAKCDVEVGTIERSLQDWSPIGTDRVPRSTIASSAEQSAMTGHRIQSIVANAEAYHHGAFVYFYRNIKGMTRRSSMVQYHAKAALAACMRVILFGGPMAALLWPLFVGACEALKDVDRKIAETVFRETMGKQGFINISQSWDVVQEIWRRGDDEQQEVAWEEIAQARGITLVFA